MFIYFSAHLHTGLNPFASRPARLVALLTRTWRTHAIHGAQSGEVPGPKFSA